MNFKERSYDKELLDQDLIPFSDIKQNMKELNFINKWLGGHLITITGFKELVGNKKEISVCEIGCGGGDNLLAVAKWCKAKGIRLSVTGIDLKNECIEFARSRNASFSSVEWIVSDYRKVNFTSKPDIVFSSLFCHHFSNHQLVFQFSWMKENSTLGFFVNDLERNAIAYYSIKLLTKVFSKSYLVKNDAPLSVARGFSKKELMQICKLASINNAIISWKWAFRYLVTSANE